MGVRKLGFVKGDWGLGVLGENGDEESGAWWKWKRNGGLGV